MPLLCHQVGDITGMTNSLFQWVGPTGACPAILDELGANARGDLIMNRVDSIIVMRKNVDQMMDTHGFKISCL